jgi:hypothetical protein
MSPSVTHIPPLKIFLADFSLFGGAESLSQAEQPAPWLPRRTEIPHLQNPQDAYGSTPLDPSDFLWLMTEEPHRSRRKAIMKAHPEVSLDPFHPVSFFGCFLLSYNFLRMQNNA